MQRAIRDQAASDPILRDRLEQKIPFPGLRAPRSQLSVPIEVGDRVLGVLHVESAQELRFTHEDEETLVVLARQFGLALRALDTDEEAPRPAPVSVPPPAAEPPLVVRHYAANDSVFLGDEYLIKGVAGAILWRLLRAYVHEKREHFSNRELRVDPTLGLPVMSENLEARIFLLERRLRERDGGIALEKTGRGRLRLVVQRPVSLVEAG